MIIKVKVDNVEISIEENHGSAEKHITMRWSDQNKQIQETIKVMSAECVKLKEACQKKDYEVTGVISPEITIKE